MFTITHAMIWYCLFPYFQSLSRTKIWIIIMTRHTPHPALSLHLRDRLALKMNSTIYAWEIGERAKLWGKSMKTQPLLSISSSNVNSFWNPWFNHHHHHHYHHHHHNHHHHYNTGFEPALGRQFVPLRPLERDKQEQLGENFFLIVIVINSKRNIFHS